MECMLPAYLDIARSMANPARKRGCNKGCKFVAQMTGSWREGGRLHGWTKAVLETRVAGFCAGTELSTIRASYPKVKSRVRNGFLATVRILGLVRSAAVTLQEVLFRP